MQNVLSLWKFDMCFAVHLFCDVSKIGEQLSNNDIPQMLIFFFCYDLKNFKRTEEMGNIYHLAKNGQRLFLKSSILLSFFQL